jgi:hypothetical protein
MLDVPGVTVAALGLDFGEGVLFDGDRLRRPRKDFSRCHNVSGATNKTASRTALGCPK